MSGTDKCFKEKQREGEREREIDGWGWGRCFRNAVLTS